MLWSGTTGALHGNIVILVKVDALHQRLKHVLLIVWGWRGDIGRGPFLSISVLSRWITQSTQTSLQFQPQSSTSSQPEKAQLMQKGTRNSASFTLTRRRDQSHTTVLAKNCKFSLTTLI